VGNGGSGIVVQNGASETVVSSNLARRNSRDGIKISNTDDWSSHCTVAGNSATANGRYGIAVLKAVDVAVVGNTVRESATSDDGNAEVSLQSGSTWGASSCAVVGNVTSSTAAHFGIDEQPDRVGPNVIVANCCDGAVHTNINRRNSDTMVAFNVGTAYRVQGTVQLAGGETTVELDETPHAGTTLSGTSVTPTSSLGAATEFWVEAADGGYRVRVDWPPGQAVDFAYTIDAR
jgi:hypothetical protein